MAENTQTQNALSPEDAQNLISQLVQWSKAGGGNAAQGASSTDTQGNVNQNMSPEITADAAQELHPIQQAALDGAVKAIKEHSYNAVNTGGANAPAIATHIVDNFGGGSPVSGGKGSSGSWSGPIPTGQRQPQSTPQPTAQPQAPAPIKATKEPDQTQANYNQAQLLLSQQAKLEAQPKNWLQRFTDQFNQRTGGITQADRIANMQGMQKIVGGEQLQPKDISTFTTDQWKAGLDATKSSLAAEAQNMSNLVDLHSKLEATKGRVKQVMGWPSDDQNKVVGKINESYGNVGKLIGNIKTLTDNAPQFSGGGVNSQAQQVVNNVQQGQKVGKYTLVNKK